ncbi:DNA-processing protein DprA [Psychromicrobium xiongbiense]|uniref:DNA-processing protein DprA n=1 Tax=Psychromicrobium xiongbiense TaxID=3051184 RepID=UPI0025532BCF|nr:DNA-processing protein DprA [Psychromicrobium sp. YIM S02556]
MSTEAEQLHASPRRYSDVQRARAALSRIMEPSDTAGYAVVNVLGPWETMRLISGHRRAAEEDLIQVNQLLGDQDEHPWSGLSAAQERWKARLSGLDPDRDLLTMERLGGGLLCPEDDLWPSSLRDLELMEPLALWYRIAAAPRAGGITALQDQRQLAEQRITQLGRGRTLALVGSRDSTSYGAAVTADLAYQLAQRGVTVLSGGAYGIDAAAHRAALAAEAAELPTVAVMAGGLDRFYPAGNEELLRSVAARGLLVAEVPPGSNPTRFRFLQRNRLIAALAGATIVVEARWRSGALSTAHHAAQIGRPVAAVPGSVMSANSAGCHRLLREGAICVTDTEEALELIEPLGAAETVQPEVDAYPSDADRGGQVGIGQQRSHHEAAEQRGLRRVYDGLPGEDLRLWDALPVRRATSVEQLGSVAGLGLSAVRAGLGRLELMGLARRIERGWIKVAAPSPSADG